jgi:hypothetical protein
MKWVRRSVHGHVKSNQLPSNQHAAQQFPFDIWNFPLLNIKQALSTCEFHVEYKSKSNVWEIRDFNPKFPINMKCLWHIDYRVASWLEHSKFQRPKGFCSARSWVVILLQISETREELRKMSTVLQVIAAVNMTRENAE